MLFFVVEHQDGIFHDFVLKSIDLDHSEVLLRMWRKLDTQSRIMHHEFGLLRLNRVFLDER